MQHQISTLLSNLQGLLNVRLFLLIQLCSIPHVPVLAHFLIPPPPWGPGDLHASAHWWCVCSLDLSEWPGLSCLDAKISLILSWLIWCFPSLDFCWYWRTWSLYDVYCVLVLVFLVKLCKLRNCFAESSLLSGHGSQINTCLQCWSSMAPGEFLSYSLLGPTSHWVRIFSEWAPK